MIIVEGADKVGKTTLARALVRELNSLGWPHTYRHLGRPPECWRHRPVEMHVRWADPYVVQDRLHLSEPVYASVTPGREPLLDPGDFGLVTRQVRAVGGHFVVVCADEQTLAGRLAEAADDQYRAEQVLAVNRAFAVAAAAGEWQGYAMPVDACQTALRGWPETRHCGLRAYTLRMLRDFPWPGARAWEGA